MAHTIRLTVAGLDGREERDFSIARAYNLGFTMRDAAKMLEHIREVGKEGIPAPVVTDPPMVMPISTWAITTETEVSAQCARTSGEVEIVTLVDEAGEIFVGVGSDHTDRELETIDIIWSKQVCPNVIAPEVWRLSEVEDHWDACALESDVTGEDGRTAPYQKASVAEFWSPREMLAGLKRRARRVPGGLIFLSGTVVSLGHMLGYHPGWTIRLVDPVLGRSIEHRYRVPILIDEIDMTGLDFIRRGSTSEALKAKP